ncbi:hypothetical protein D3C71_1605420 [compost metagenome]
MTGLTVAIGDNRLQVNTGLNQHRIYQLGCARLDLRFEPFSPCGTAELVAELVKAHSQNLPLAVARSYGSDFPGSVAQLAGSLGLGHQRPAG